MRIVRLDSCNVVVHPDMVAMIGYLITAGCNSGCRCFASLHFKKTISRGNNIIFKPDAFSLDVIHIHAPAC